MALSSLAETLADYARSEAKRASNETAGVLHLLAAMRRWQEEVFDKRYPGLGEEVRKLIAAGRGSAIVTPDLQPEVVERLENVRNAEDAWGIADLLAAEVDRLAESTNDSAAEVEVARTGQESTGRVSSDHPARTPEPEPDPLPFAITEGLIGRASEVVGMDAAKTASLLLTAAHSVAVEILGSNPAELFAELCAASGIEGVEPADPGTAGEIVARIAASSTAGAGRVATQVALALVEVAEWSAARDETVTAEETDRIDTVRLRLREQLADKIDAESEAMVAFEQKFSHLVGMESVKTEIRRRVDFLVVNKRRLKRGMPTAPQRMHMAFVGNPGTFFNGLPGAG